MCLTSIVVLMCLLNFYLTIDKRQIVEIANFEQKYFQLTNSKSILYNKIQNLQFYKNNNYTEYNSCDYLKNDQDLAFIATLHSSL